MDILHIRGKIQIEKNFNINISKIDSNTEYNIENTELCITDLDGNIIKEIKTINDINELQLPTGDYILIETLSNENYKAENEKLTYFTVTGSQKYNDNSCSIGFEIDEEKSVNAVEHKVSLDQFPNYGTNLYDNGYFDDSYRYSKIEFDIETDLTEDIYVIVSINGWGVYFNSEGPQDWDDNLDWVEFLQWTKVQNNTVVSSIPVISEIWGYRCTKTIENGSIKYSLTGDPTIMSLAPHFYTSDGVEVTDQVTVSNVQVIYYTEGDTTVTKYDDISSDNVTLNDAQDTIIITNEHIKTTVNLTKSDKENSSELLEGAVYEIQDADGNVVATFETTDENGNSVLEDLNLNVGTYYIAEVSAPEGYKISDEKKEITVKARTNETVSVNVSDETTKVEISKVDEYGNALSGAVLQILDSNGNIVQDENGKNIEFTTTGTSEVITKLDAGTYKIHEIYAPLGYEKSEDIEFTIDNKGNTIYNGEENYKITIIDKVLTGNINFTKNGEIIENTEKVSKIDSKYSAYKFVWTTGVVPNAVYELYAKNDVVLNGTKIYSADEKIGMIITDENGAATYSGLPVGEYYVIEKIAPTQYEVDANKNYISLTAKYDDEYNQTLIETVSLTDERKKLTVTLTKTEANSNNSVEGAIYGLYNQEKIAELESDTLLDVIRTDENGKGTYEIDLPVGNYYVKEIEAPEGYLLSEEVKFINFEQSANLTINVEDERKEISKTKVTISKQDITTCEEIAGAKLTLKTEDGKVIEEWTSSTTPHEISAELEKDATYVLVEETAPEGYVKAEEITFTVGNTDETQKVVMYDDYTKIAVNKTDKSGNLLSGATLRIIDKDGNEIAKWKTDDKTYTLEKVLKAGETYELEEVEAPDGYKKADNIEFTVSEDGSLDTITMKDKKQSIIPQTGQARILYIILGVIIIACVVGLIVIKVKRKNSHKK